MLNNDGQGESNELVANRAVLHAYDDGVYVVTEFGAIPLVDHPHLLDALRACCVQHAEQDQAHGQDTSDAPTGEGLFRAGQDGAVWFVEGRRAIPIHASPELHQCLIERCRRYAEVIGWSDPA